MPLLRWIPQQMGQEFGHCLSLPRPTSGTPVCSISNVHHPAISLLQRDRIPLDFALVHQRVRDSTDEAHVDPEAEAKVLILCIVSIERKVACPGLSAP